MFLMLAVCRLGCAFKYNTKFYNLFMFIKGFNDVYNL